MIGKLSFNHKYQNIVGGRVITESCDKRGRWVKEDCCSYLLPPLWLYAARVPVWWALVVGLQHHTFIIRGESWRFLHLLHKVHCKMKSFYIILKIHLNWYFYWYLNFWSQYHMMHHIVPWGTALCSAILHPPKVKSCRIFWCVVQSEHIVKNPCDLLGFQYFQRLLSTQFIHSKGFWTFYCAFYKYILHFLNPDTALKNKVDNWTNGKIFTWYPRVWFMSSNIYLHNLQLLNTVFLSGGWLFLCLCFGQGITIFRKKAY